VRVVIVDDQELMRRGLALLLGTEDGIEVVGQASSGREALAFIATWAPDVVLSDARMPGMDGIELTAQLSRQYPQLPVIMLTTFDDEGLVRGALDAGAAGFLLKDTSPDELTAAITAVIGGGLVIDPRVAQTALRSSSQVETDGPLAILTRSERLVAAEIAKGSTNSQIAASLVISEGTVKNYVSNLLRKLDQRDRTGLALMLARYLG
jgi:DNA-binding NarL/FixJ family response regulator